MSAPTVTEDRAGEPSVDRIARLYGEHRFAIAWTVGKEGEDAKRVRTKGWPTIAPFVSAEDAIAEFAAQEEHRNPAVVLRASNLIGIDCDTAEGLAELEKLGLPPTLTARSSGEHKRHYYFRPPTALEAIPYVAFRFERDRVSADKERYLVCPPALHPSGSTYAFLPECGAEIAELPADVYKTLVERASREASGQRERLALAPGAKVKEGQRRSLVFRFACMLRRWHADDHEAILEAAFSWNERHCEPPLSREQVAAQVDGAIKYPGGQELARPTPSGPEEPPDTGALLEAVMSGLREYVVLGEDERTALALWVLHTHTFEVAGGALRSATEVTPYIQIHSATPGCGKSLLLEILEPLVREPWRVDGLTKSVLVRKTDARCPTLLLDEMDRMWAGDKEVAAALEQVLNGGYRRRGLYTMSVTEGGDWKERDFRTFSPKAFAGIGRLSGALATRTIPIWMHPALPGEQVREKFEEELWAETAELRGRLERWGIAQNEPLRALRVAALPEGLQNRTREIWRPLLAIAELAGGEWPVRARAAAVKLHTSHSDELDDRLRLLTDIRAVFHVLAADRLHTADLLAALAAIEESPWRGRWWDDSRDVPKAEAAAALAKNLAGYGIRPEQVRIGETSKKGYRRERFEDPWRRYLPHHAAETAETPETPCAQKEGDVSAVSPVSGGRGLIGLLGRNRLPF